MRNLTMGALAALVVAISPAARGQETVPQTGQRAETLRGILQRITLPPGFEIALYALVPDARHMAVASDGTVFVGTRRQRVWRVAPGGGEVRPFAPDIRMTMPNGPCLAPDGTLYVAEQNRILAFPAAATNPESTARVVVAQGELIPPSEQSGNHSARVCRIGPDDRLYVSLGQPYNVSPRSKQALYRETGIGGIIRMARDGSGREVYATGIRNSVGLDFNPKDGTLWWTDNQVDGMGDDIPPGEINRSTRAGQDFGFPYYGGGKVATNEYRNDPPPRNVVFPEVETVAHAADLGMAFYTGTVFPTPWRGAIFSAQHGSWDRSTPVGARVIVTTFKSDGSVDRSQPFAEGWIGPNGRYLGRPVDVAVMPDGAILVSDDLAGALYRISWRGPRQN